MTRLATVADLNAVLGSSYDEVDERIVRLIELASAMVQNEAGQTLELVEGDVVTLFTEEDAFYLPERPVVALNSVEVTPLNSTLPYSLSVADLRVQPWGAVSSPTRPWRWGSTVEVDYDHGYAVIPDDLVTLTCVIAGRMVSNPTREASESIMQYSYTHADGGAVFPEVERRAIRAKYRPGSRSVRIRGPRES